MAGRGVSGEELRPHHLGDRRRHHDDAGTQRLTPAGLEHQQVGGGNAVRLQRLAHHWIA